MDVRLKGRWVRYQLRWLADQSPQKLMVKSRRCGISDASTYERACRGCGIELIPGKPPRRIKPVPQHFMSASHEQSKVLLARALQHVQAFGIGFGGKLIAKHGKVVAELGTGVPMKAHSTNPNSVRGEEGDWLLDEWAATPNQDGLWAAVSASAKATLGNPLGYRIAVVFTPLGDDNMAYEMAQGKLARAFSQHRVTIHDAVRDSFPITYFDRDALEYRPGTIADLMAEIGDPDIFAQEYECSFLSASTRYIPASVYEAACYESADLPKDFHTINNTVEYGGLDVARVRDRTAFTRLALHAERSNSGTPPPVAWHLYTDVNQNMSWDKQEAWVEERMAGIARIAVDGTMGSLGSQFAERLDARHQGRVEIVNFTLASKEEMASGLKLGLTMKRLRPRRDDIELKREVLSMRREITSAGNVRYLAPREGGGHGDRAWSLALAMYATGGAAKPIGLIPKVSTPDTTRSPVGRVRPGGWR